MTLTNFLVIGAWKSATTSLRHYPAQHPDIYTSPGKQTYFFAFEGEDPNFSRQEKYAEKNHQVLHAG